MSSGIRGGANNCTATCWYNPHGKTAALDAGFSYEIAQLGELPAIAVRGAP